MENKKIIWGGLAGGVAFMLLGMLFYGFLMKDFFAGQATPGIYKEIPDFPFLIIGNLGSGFLMAMIVGRWAKATSAGEGFKIGLTVGLLLGIGFDITMYAVSNIMTMKGALTDIAVSTVMAAIVGAIVAMVMTGSKKTA